MADDPAAGKQRAEEIAKNYLADKDLKLPQIKWDKRFETMNEEEIIYQHLDDIPRVVPDYDGVLREDYAVFNERHFWNSLPPLSESFICAFQGMPGDKAGMYISPDRAEGMSTNETRIRPGIRINSKLKGFTPHGRIVLLHEMIHAYGIVGHKEDFRAFISALLKEGVYEVRCWCVHFLHSTLHAALKSLVAQAFLG